MIPGPNVNGAAERIRGMGFAVGLHWSGEPGISERDAHAVTKRMEHAE